MHTTRLMKLGILAALLAMTVVFIAVAALAIAVLLPGDDDTVEAGGMWFAWLYQPENDMFLRVYEDGTTQEYTLDLPAGERIASSPQTFAPNGEWLAFCTFNEATGTVNFRVHNFNPEAAAKAGQTFPVVYELGQNKECSVAQNAFNKADPTKIAVGVTNYNPGIPEADTTGPQWELLVFDVTSGTVTARYDATMPGADQILPYEGARWAWMPLVHSFEGEQVYFELAPWGTEFMPGVMVVAWQVGTQTVTPTQDLTNVLGHVVNPATREVVWPAIDESLPQAQPMGPMPAYNVVLYQHPSMDGSVTIFNQPGTIVGQLVFVMGGESLAINAIPGFDPDNPPQGPDSNWLLLERSGAVTPLNLPPSVYRIAGLRDGFAAWSSNYETRTASLTRYMWNDDPANPTVTTIWEGTNPNWMMVWSVEQATGGDSQLFTPISP